MNSIEREKALCKLRSYVPVIKTKDQKYLVIQTATRYHYVKASNPDEARKIAENLDWATMEESNKAIEIVGLK